MARCRHEIEEATCGVCRPRRGGEPARPAAYGPWVAARYPGRCDGCDERIRVDDQIRSDGEDGWLCAECGAP